MGIDVHARWKGQTKKEKDAQITGFSIEHGHVGYLREAYHGGPYATRTLVAEAFDEDVIEQLIKKIQLRNNCDEDEAWNKFDGVPIPAITLRERLRETLEAAQTRSLKNYGRDALPEVLNSFTNFVELCEQKEKETGEPVYIYASF